MRMIKSVDGTRSFIGATQKWQTAHGLARILEEPMRAREKDGYDYTQEEQDTMNLRMPCLGLWHTNIKSGKHSIRTMVEAITEH